MSEQGTIAFVLIFFQSFSVIRHAFYETFLHLHILLASLSLVAVWIHLDGLSQQQFLMAAVAIWAIEVCITKTPAIKLS